jgi:hypothetical protein
MIISRLACLTAALAILSACGETPTAPGSLDPQFDRVNSQKSAKSERARMVRLDTHHSQVAADPIDVVCPAGDFPFKSIGEGSGRPIGKFTVVVLSCLNFPTRTYSKVETTFTTKGGDELRFEMDPLNPAQIVVFQPPTGPIEVTSAQHIVGGTGRFEGATGYVTGHLVGTLPITSASVTTTGEVSRPGKSGKSKKSKKS